MGSLFSGESLILFAGPQVSVPFESASTLPLSNLLPLHLEVLDKSEPYSIPNLLEKVIKEALQKGLLILRKD